MQSNKFKSFKGFKECDTCHLLFDSKIFLRHMELGLCALNKAPFDFANQATIHNFTGYIMNDAYYTNNILLIDKQTLQLPLSFNSNIMCFHPDILKHLKIKLGQPVKLDILKNNAQSKNLSNIFFIAWLYPKLELNCIGLTNPFLYSYLRCHKKLNKKENYRVHSCFNTKFLPAKLVKIIVCQPNDAELYKLMDMNDVNFKSYFLYNTIHLPITVGTLIPLHFMATEILFIVAEVQVKNSDLPDNLQPYELNQDSLVDISNDSFEWSKDCENDGQLSPEGSGDAQIISGCSISTLKNSFDEINDKVLSASTPCFNKNQSKSVTYNESETRKLTQLDNVLAKMHSSTRVIILSESESAGLRKLTLDSPGDAQNLVIHSSHTTMTGLDSIMPTLRHLIKDPLTNKQAFSRHSVRLPKGILLHGPSGVGKTMSVHSIVQEMGPAINFHSFNLKSPTSTFDKEGKDASIEFKLRDFFHRLLSLKNRNRGDSFLVFIDEIDAFFPNRSNGMTTLSEKTLLATFVSFLDEILKDDSGVIVITATNSIDAIDLSLRRPGRLEYEIEYSIPTNKDRSKILSHLLRSGGREGDAKVSHQLTEEQIENVARVTHGYTGADLVGLVNRSGLECLERHLTQNCKDSTESTSSIITYDDFCRALKTIKPSAMREISLDIPEVRWDQIGGMVHIKRELIRAVEWPLKHPDSFKRLGVRPKRGVLLHGPPGCSKTMIAKALATESKLNFFSVKGPELFSKYVGESEKMIREIFRKAKRASPSIIFFDEIDALATERSSSSGGSSSSVGDRVIAQLLTEMDGFEKMDDVFVLAATNRPDKIDKALLRPGRLGKIIHVPLPDHQTRIEILKIKFKEMPIDGNDITPECLANSSKGFSGAEIVALCQEAAIQAMEEDFDIPQIKKRHFDIALQQIHPLNDDAVLCIHEKFGNLNLD